MTPGQYVVQQFVNIVSLGSLYALVAVGLSIIFGILRLTNFAHGDMMMVGAFAVVLLNAGGLPFAWALLAGVAAGALAGIVVERVAYRPVRGAADVTLLLTSLGVTYVLENLGILLFSASPRNFPVPDWLDQSFNFQDGAITVTSTNIFTTALTLASLLFLGWFVTRTDTGIGMRAAAEDITAAHLVGLRVDRLMVVAFALASGFAGLAGVLWAAQAGAINPQMGFLPLLKAFVAAIVGGFGSIPGALLGSYLLAALEVCIVGFLPDDVASYRDALVFTLLILFLLFRPGGLMQPNREVKL